MLGRFEELLADAVEGGMRRIFSTQLQPVQIAKAAARAMEDAQVVGFRGPEVPNVYRVRLAPVDLARFAGYQVTMSRQLAQYLTDYAHDRGLAPVAPPRVEIVEDRRVRAGSVKVDARFQDIEPERQASLEQALEDTRALQLRQMAETPPPDSGWTGEGWLVDEQGTRYPLDPREAVVRLGRSLENDVVLDDQRVSRYHAQLRWNGRGWAAHDLQSTNGTYVDDVPVRDQPLILGPDGLLRLGGQTLRLVEGTLGRH
jgi:hypothetical protein